jgi:NADPH:quinone reductase-like Zn-dependent oxidoreductase
MGVNAMTYLWEHPEILHSVRRKVIELCAQGRVAPVVHGEFGFEQAAQVLTSLGEGEVLGKAVIRVR